MSLRNRLLALSLLTLLLPWSGWKLLQELERFLREAQESALLGTARTLAATLPFEQLSQLQFLPEQYAQLRSMRRAPELDGYIDDWPDSEQGLALGSEDGHLHLNLLAGSDGSALYLLFDVQADPAELSIVGSKRNGVEVLLRSPRGLQRFELRPEAPGPIQMRGEGGEGQAEGFWLETSRGYRLELALPGQARLADLQFNIEYEQRDGSIGHLRSATASSRSGWLALIPPWTNVSSMLAAATPEATRVWLVDRQGWVLADAGTEQELTAVETTWLQRIPYRLVAGGRTELIAMPEDAPLRMQGDPVSQALHGREATLWSQDPDSAVLSNTVAVPVLSESRILGAFVLQSRSDGLLLLTNRALGRLLLTTLVISFGLAAGLWFFATRLSRRVRRLGAAVSVAMDEGMVSDALPLTADRDELGQLARNNEKLLRAVAEYNQYLQTLAGKLSHELKTPLAITRSSLENLSSQPLDHESRRFLQRAQEGVERQTAIVRAMSEASRLEASIKVAEWEEVDLARWLGSCVEGYRSVHPGRKIDTRTKASSVFLRCSPELLAQALDKLVDNAISLTGPGDSVCLSLKESEDEVVLAVQNSGTRLPQEFQGRLFDSLVSLRESTGAASHLGLGLYIVRLVAQAHGGQASARNLPADAGVEFALNLPFKRA